MTSLVFVPYQVLGLLVIIVLCCAMAAYELWLWRQRRTASRHLWTGLLSVLLGVYSSLHVAQFMASEDLVAHVLPVTLTSLVLLTLALAEYSEALTERSMPISRRWRLAFAVPLIVLTLTTDWVVSEHVQVQWFWWDVAFRGHRPNASEPLVLTPLLLGAVGSVVWAVRGTRDPEARRLLSMALGVWLVSMGHDYIVVNFHLRSFSYLLEYGFLGLVVASMVLDVRRYAALLEAADRAQARWRQEVTVQQEGIQALFDTAPMPVAVHQEGTIVYANRAMTTALAPPHTGSLVGRHLLDWVDARFHICADEGLVRRVADDPAPVPLVVRARGGKTLQWEAHALPFRFDGIESVAVVARDITAEREMRAKTMRLDRMVTAGTLAAGVAHEINNPLTFVLGNLEHAQLQLAEHPLPVASIEAALGDARDGALRVRDIVADLGRLARPGAQSSRVRLAEVVGSAERLAHNEARHRARLVVEVAPELRVRGDSAKLGQVFLNLLLNAAHAIELGNVSEHTIAIRAGVQGDTVVVTVEDDGEGIAPEHLAHVFDPFFTTKAVGEGTGLGLAICRDTVLACGGDIWVESEPGRGTTFSVRLPLDAQPTPPRPAQRAAAPADAARILVIDDEASVCRALKRMLAPRSVVTTLQAEEALGWLRAGERYDAILCDVMMPQVTGQDFYLQLEALDAEQAARVVFISGGTFGELGSFFLHPPRPLVTKPFTREELIEGLLRVMPQDAVVTSGSR